MNVKIESRRKTDVGGILMMPLRRNVPLPQEPDWKATICLNCGRECWERPLPPGYKVARKLCTACALEEVVNGC